MSGREDHAAILNSLAAKESSEKSATAARWETVRARIEDLSIRVWIAEVDRGTKPLADDLMAICVQPEEAGPPSASQRGVWVTVGPTGIQFYRQSSGRSTNQGTGTVEYMPYRTDVDEERELAGKGPDFEETVLRGLASYMAQRWLVIDEGIVDVKAAARDRLEGVKRRAVAESERDKADRNPQNIRGAADAYRLAFERAGFPCSENVTAQGGLVTTRRGFKRHRENELLSYEACVIQTGSFERQKPQDGMRDHESTETIVMFLLLGPAIPAILTAGRRTAGSARPDVQLGFRASRPPNPSARSVVILPHGMAGLTVSAMDRAVSEFAKANDIPTPDRTRTTESS